MNRQQTDWAVDKQDTIKSNYTHVTANKRNAQSVVPEATVLKAHLRAKLKSKQNKTKQIN